jgi:signal transduction histidine kinase
VTKPFPLAELTHRVERLLGQKHTVADLLKKIEGLRDKMREQEAALREIIHDLKTPLITIGASAKLLMREEAPDEKLKFLRNIYESTLGLTHWLDDILAYSDLSRDGVERRKEKIELCSLTRMVVELFRPIGEKKGVEVRLGAPPAEIYMVGEKRWIQRGLENLLGNAVKFTPAGGAVLVEIGKKETPGGARGEIRVRDSGSGIDPEDLPRIFDPFYRGRNSQSETGIGVGLSIVKRVMELHRGEVEVQSEPGKGSLFSIHFPLETQKEEGNEASKNLQICNIPVTII